MKTVSQLPIRKQRSITVPQYHNQLPTCPIKASIWYAGPVRQDWLPEERDVVLFGVVWNTLLQDRRIVNWPKEARLTNDTFGECFVFALKHWQQLLPVAVSKNWTLGKFFSCLRRNVGRDLIRQVLVTNNPSSLSLDGLYQDETNNPLLSYQPDILSGAVLVELESRLAASGGQRRLRYLHLLLAGVSDQEAVKLLDVDRKTLWRWRRQIAEILYQVL